jgi:hypothetical protein
MNETHSALYAGVVSHQRFAPKPHRLRYALFQMLLDLDEAQTLARRLRLFSANRFNVFSHYDRDHGDGRPGALRAWVEDTLAEAGNPIDGGRILLLCMPRLFGHVFNPLSIYCCHRPDGELAAVLHEVNNTFGERHCYLIEVGPRAKGVIRQSCAKAFHVSPFLDLDMTYEFELTAPGDVVRSTVRGNDPRGAPIIAASFVGRRRALTDRALLAMLVGFPLQTLKVVGAIHLEALKLWLKGVKLKPRPPAPATRLTVCR